MIKEYTHKCEGTCSRELTIKYDTETNKIVDLDVVGGCNGNLKAIGKLVEGEPIEKVIKLLEGNTCGGRPTSCADQLSKALKEVL